MQIQDPYQFQHIEAETKWPPFSGHFGIHFFNNCILVQISLEFIRKDITDN